MKQKSSFRRILGYAARYKFSLFFAFLSAIIYVSATLYAPKLVGKAIDKYIVPQTFKLADIEQTVLILSIVVVTGALFGFIMNSLLNKVTYKIVKDLRIDAFNKVLRVPVKYLDSHLSGDLLTRIVSDTETVSDGLLQGFSQSLTGLITIVVTIVMMLTIRWQIGLVVVFLTPLSLFVATFIAKKNHKTFTAQAQLRGEMGGFLNEMIQNQRIVIAYNHQNDNVEKFKEIDQRLYHAGFKAQFASSLTNPCTRVVNNIVYASVAMFGALYIVKYPTSAFTVGGLVAFLSYSKQYTKPFNEISAVATELTNSFASLKRVFDFIDAPEIVDEQKYDDISITKGSVEFNNVSFRYLEDKPLIENLNVKINPGQKVAIVGPTGCGKTTMINLLMRYYDTNNGNILIDNNMINLHNRDSLRNEVGMVLQDTWLFKGSIYDNIRYGNLETTQEQVIKASKMAYADTFIRNLPDGYNTIVSDDIGLSIGEKQLICIARMMLRESKILILDEATSNIDTRTEVMVQKAFNNLMQNKTSFIIAHRLSTIRNADKILVMKDGNIIEIGTHQELLDQKGFYYNLYNSQFAK